MIDSLRWLASFARLKIGLLLVRAGGRLSGVVVSQRFKDTDRVLEVFRRDHQRARPNPGLGGINPPPQAVVGERGREMLRDGQRARRAPPPPPSPPLKGSVADRLAQRDSRALAKGV